MLILRNEMTQNLLAQRSKQNTINTTYSTHAENDESTENCIKKILIIDLISDSTLVLRWVHFLQVISKTMSIN